MRKFKITKRPSINSKSFVGEKHYNELKRAKHNPLSPEEEMNLFYKAQSGDLESRNRLINANLRFVYSVAKSYQGKGLELADLIQEGNIGLIKSIENFDPTKGFKFCSHAVYYIRTSILDAINKNGGTVKIPDRVMMAKRIYQFSNQFLQTEEREPSFSEIAEGLGISEKRVGRALGALKTNSLFFFSDEGEEKSILDIIGAEDDSFFFEKRGMSEVLSCLTEKEKKILELRLNGGMFTAISEGLETSEKAVIYHFRKGIEKIKNNFSEQELQSLVS